MVFVQWFIHCLEIGAMVVYSRLYTRSQGAGFYANAISMTVNLTGWCRKFSEIRHQLVDGLSHDL